MRASFFLEFSVCKRLPQTYLNTSSSKPRADCQLLMENLFQGHDILIIKKKKYSIVLPSLLHSEQCSSQECFRAQDEVIKEKTDNIKFIIQLLTSEHSFTGFQSTNIKKHDDNPISEVLSSTSTQNCNQHSMCKNQSVPWSCHLLANHICWKKSDSLLLPHRRKSVRRERGIGTSKSGSRLTSFVNCPVSLPPTRISMTLPIN